LHFPLVDPAFAKLETMGAPTVAGDRDHSTGAGIFATDINGWAT
jgi:hypothetical protein